MTAVCDAWLRVEFGDEFVLENPRSEEQATERPQWRCGSGKPAARRRRRRSRLSCGRFRLLEGRSNFINQTELAGRGGRRCRRGQPGFGRSTPARWDWAGNGSTCVSSRSSSSFLKLANERSHRSTQGGFDFVGVPWTRAKQQLENRHPARSRKRAAKFGRTAGCCGSHPPRRSNRA